MTKEVVAPSSIADAQEAPEIPLTALSRINYYLAAITDPRNKTLIQWSLWKGRARDPENELRLITDPVEIYHAEHVITQKNEKENRKKQATLKPNEVLPDPTYEVSTVEDEAGVRIRGIVKVENPTAPGFSSYDTIYLHANRLVPV